MPLKCGIRPFKKKMYCQALDPDVTSPQTVKEIEQAVKKK